MISFQVNGSNATFDGSGNTPLLWVLRDHMHLRGTKFACGIGQCGACSVQVNGALKRSCITPVSSIAGAVVTTIEGLAPTTESLHPVQQAWLEMDVPQCGYCQAGQLMAAAALLEHKAQPSDEDIDRGMTNICRCGTYLRIRQAIHRAAELKARGAADA